MSQNNSTPLILIDGSSYLYRAFHALPPLTNSNGQPTGAIFGVLNMIRSLIKEYHPTKIAVIFDAKGKTFRHHLYPKYKSHRPPMPDDLILQIKPLQEIIQAMGLPMLIIENVEADDVIGTLAKLATKHKLDTVVSSCDKDLAQLVNSHISLVNTMSKTILDTQGVIQKFGVSPKLIIDYLTLIGDSSDNIPGVPKVGPKTAVKWLNEYGSLDAIIANADKISGKVGENLRNSLHQLPLTKKLVTIDCEVDLPLTLQELAPQPQNQDKLTKLYKNLEFKNWLNELLDTIKEKSANNKNYVAIFKEKDFHSLLQKLKTADLFAIDTETTSLNYMDAEIVGLSFAVKANEAFYLPLAHDYPNMPQQLPRDKVLAALKPILADVKLKKVGQNLKYDKEILANYNIELQGIAYDTMLESYVLNSTVSRHDLDTLALKHLAHKNITYTEITGTGAKQIPFKEVPIAQATNYAAEDADIALQLHQYFWPQITKHPNIKHVLQKIEIPLIEVLVRMERHGVLVDVDFLQQQSNEIAEHLLNLEQQIFTLAECTFNIDSPKQLQEILYTKLGLPILKKTPKGQPSTAEPVLQELALNFPLPKLILQYRSLSKLKSTYTDKLPQQVNQKTNRIHTSYQQAVTATGRLSSSNPNLQNIPIRTEAGKRIRKAFIAPTNYKILAADYSQIELRLMAHLSQDKGLLYAFSQGLDIHKATAAQVFGVKLNEVTADQRRKAKAINFGLMYGMSAFGLAKQIGVERAAAQAYIDAYFAQYPAVREYMQKTCDFASQYGYVETLFGRRLYATDINSRDKQRQNAAKRAAINAPLQGTAADIIKLAMISVDKWIQESQLDIHMIMQVHDELVFEVATDTTTTAKKHIIQLMNNAAQLSVPLIVDIGVGDNWEEAH